MVTVRETQQAILRGENISTAPRRSRACAYRAPSKGKPGDRSKKRSNSANNNSGKVQARAGKQPILNNT